MKHHILSRPGYFLKLSLFGAVLLFTMGGVNFLGSQKAAAIPLTPTVIAAAPDKADVCDKRANGPGGFFGLEPWYRFMGGELGTPKHGDTPADPCGVRCFNIFVQADPNDCGQTQSDVPGVFLAVIDDLLRIAGLVAIIFIIIGSFQYVGSRGNSERTAAAQSTIISALTGLAVALVAVAFVSFLGNRLS